MSSQYPAENQYDWRAAQFQHCSIFPQTPYTQDYARPDYSALLETNYALAQAQITQVQINQVTTLSRLKEDNAYQHDQGATSGISRERGYPSYPPAAHTSAVSDHLQKFKLDSDQSSNRQHLASCHASNASANNDTNSSHNWMKNADWNHHVNAAAITANIVNDQHQIQNYYHQNAQRSYWS